SDSNTVIGITSLPLQERKRATTHESLITLFSLYHIRTYVSIALYTLKKKCTSSEPIWVNHSVLTLSSRFSGNNKLNTNQKMKAMKKVMNQRLIMSSDGELKHIQVHTSSDKRVAMTPIPGQRLQKTVNDTATASVDPTPAQAHPTTVRTSFFDHIA